MREDTVTESQLASWLVDVLLQTDAHRFIKLPASALSNRWAVHPLSSAGLQQFWREGSQVCLLPCLAKAVRCSIAGSAGYVNPCQAPRTGGCTVSRRALVCSARYQAYNACTEADVPECGSRAYHSHTTRHAWLGTGWKRV